MRRRYRRHGRRRRRRGRRIGFVPKRIGGRGLMNKGESVMRIPRAFPTTELVSTFRTSFNRKMHQNGVNSQSNWQLFSIGGPVDGREFFMWNGQDAVDGRSAPIISKGATTGPTPLYLSYRNWEIMSQFYEWCIITGYWWKMLLIRDNDSSPDNQTHYRGYQWVINQDGTDASRYDDKDPVDWGGAYDPDWDPTGTAAEQVWNDTETSAMREKLNVSRRVRSFGSWKISPAENVTYMSTSGYVDLLTTRRGGRYGDLRQVDISAHPHDCPNLVRHTIANALSASGGFENRHIVAIIPNIAENDYMTTQVGFKHVKMEVKFNVRFINRKPTTTTGP